MSLSKISRALESRLAQFANAEGVDVAWPGSTYDPAGKVEFLVPAMLPAEPAPITIGTSGEDRLQGLMQVDVHRARDEGPGALRRRADEVAAQFKRGTHLSEEGLTVTCLRAWAGPEFVSGKWRVVPVSVRWYCYS